MLIDMQHYSCPIRLLDWSRSPYVALYFTVNNNFHNDGALYVWQWYRYVLNYQMVYKKNLKSKQMIFSNSRNTTLFL